MSIITLTTDLGNRGFYVASVKAAILSSLPDATIVDITHSIKPFHISSAAFTIRNVYNQFSEGTIHIIAVDTMSTYNEIILGIKTDGHYFIGPNNGLFSLVFKYQPIETVEITIPPKPAYLNFPATDIMVKAAVHFAKGGKLAEIGKELTYYVQATEFQPIYNDTSIRTLLIYIDEYGNCIFNLDKDLFERVGRNRKFTIEVNRNPIEAISHTYSGVGKGKLLALFTCFGLLEIAINFGNASELLGLKERDSILIIFE